MGFWKTLFSGGADAADEKKESGEKTFDLMKYDGVKAMRMGQFEYAVKCFREALKTKDDLEVRDYLSQALVRVGQTGEALNELRVITDRQPSNMAALLQAAHVAYMDEDYEAMTDFCRRGEELDGNNAMVQLMTARAALGQGDMVQAVARLTKAVALDERLGDARLLRAQTLLRMGDTDSAQADADWLQDRVDENEDVMLLQARIAAAKGQAQQAIACYGRVIDLNPFHTDAYRERGRLRYEQGDKAGALEDMQKVLELNPEETADVSGEYSAEGIEQKTRQAYSNLNPFGI